MVRTELIFFGSYQDSLYGTLRGTISFIPMFVLFSYLSNKYVLSGLLALIICSSIGVQLPVSMVDTILYNMLVGFCISTCYICLDHIMVENPRFGFSKSVSFVCLFTMFIVVLGVMTHLVSVSLDLYHS